jgi:hypothetical protein
MFTSEFEIHLDVRDQKITMPEICENSKKLIAEIVNNTILANKIEQERIRVMNAKLQVIIEIYRELLLSPHGMSGPEMTSMGSTDDLLEILKPLKKYIKHRGTHVLKSRRLHDVKMFYLDPLR